MSLTFCKCEKASLYKLRIILQKSSRIVFFKFINLNICLLPPLIYG
jgi:hypothetical protein